MTLMTKPQRYALKLALEYMTAAMKSLAFDASVAMSDANAPPSMQKRLEQYKQVVAAMQVIEEMLRGTQGELGI